MGYWVLGNIHRYWVVLLLGDIFCWSDTQYNTDQTAVGTVHMPVNDYLVPLVTCTLTDAIVCLDTMLICCCLLNTIIVIIIEFWAFSWSLLCSTLVLVLGIGIARGQYYWVLDIGCLSWYRSNPNNYNIRLKNCLLYLWHLTYIVQLITANEDNMKTVVHTCPSRCPDAPVETANTCNTQCTQLWVLRDIYLTDRSFSPTMYKTVHFLRSRVKV